MSSITIISGEGQRVEMDRRLCMHSLLIQDMLTTLGFADDPSQSLEIPLASFVKTSTLNKVKEYLVELDSNKPEDHRVVRVPNAQQTGEIQIQAPEYMMQTWELKFSDNLDEDQLYDLLITANYLDIASLLSMCTSVVANMIRGRPADELREILGIECDFTPDELEQIHRENVWLVD